MPEFGFASSAGGDDELGIWQALPVALPRDLGLESVGEEPAADRDVTLWQVALPRDRRAANDVLALAERRLAAAELALPFAAQRLTTFVGAGGPPAALPPALAAPETALFDWVATGDVARGQPPDAGPVNQVAAFFDKVHESLRNYAAIDTGLEDGRIGLTLVSWTGDFQTVWARGLALDDAQQHTAAVALALRTRDAWLRLGLTVARGAIQLTALFSVNPALALPAAYRFVRQVIDQVQALGGLRMLS